MSAIDRMYGVVKRPVITEKATDDSARRNAYHFRVPIGANKIEIRNAIEKLFEVQVLNVNTMRVGGKSRRRGWRAGRSADWKKAMVTLAEGDVIEML